MRRDVGMQMIDPETYHTQHSYQSSIGFQRQLGGDMSVQADYAYTASRNEAYVRNANLGYDPATGANYAFRDISHLPFPELGSGADVLRRRLLELSRSPDRLHEALQPRWQASTTYTLSGLWDAIGAPDVGFPLAPDLGADYSLAVSDQRHRAVFNGIWQLGYGFQLSGVYFYGSGPALSDQLRRRPSQRRHRRQSPAAPGRVDRSAQQLRRRSRSIGWTRAPEAVPDPGRIGIDGILEVFNLFNHANYGAYTTTEVSPATARRTSTICPINRGRRSSRFGSSSEVAAVAARDRSWSARRP